MDPEDIYNIAFAIHLRNYSRLRTLIDEVINKQITHEFEDVKFAIS
ncbi:MAG: hypothetical protein ACOC38_10620 [Promethearchaeia archaeon]